MSATLLLCVVSVIFTRDMSSVEGKPTIDLSSGDTVVQKGGLSVRGTTTQCYGSLPSFTWEYVFTDGSSSPILLSGDPVTATTGGSCSSGSSLYTGSVTVNYNVPAVYGETVHLRLTMNNNPSFSTTSTGTLTFIALYNLTGTSDIAVLGQQFTWTCQMVIPKGEKHTIVSFYRNDTNVGSVGNVTDCRGFSIDPRYNYSCTSLREFNLIIPSQNMTEEENNTIWRCAYFGGNPTHSSVQKKLVIGNKPEVYTVTPSPYKVEEGQTAIMTCRIIAATPNTNILWTWIKTDSPNNILHTGPTYTISSIQKGQSGRYNCTATNIIGTSPPATVQVDVLLKRNAPNNISVNCAISKGSALVKWIPSSESGAEQMFVVSYRTNGGSQKNTTQIYLRYNVTVTGLKDGMLYFFKVIASDRDGEALSKEVSCVTLESTALESDIGVIIGCTVGSICLVIIIVLFILIKRKNQIKCLERSPKPRKKESEVSNRTTELKGQENDDRAHYEELKSTGQDQEKSYDVIQSSSRNTNEDIVAKYESLDLQPPKEENKYNVLETIEDEKDTDSEMRTSANVYITCI